MYLLCVKSFHVYADVGQGWLAILNVDCTRGDHGLLLMEIIISIWILNIAHVWASLLLAQDVAPICMVIHGATALLAPLTSTRVVANNTDTNSLNSRLPSTLYLIHFSTV